MQKVRIAKSHQFVKSKLEKASNELFIDQHKYHFIYVNLYTNDVCVGKADLHQSDKLEFSPLNQALINAYNFIYNGVNMDKQQIEEELDDSFI
jgi:hypothetical protein